mmetsp:Transcript_3054/g.6607  ORF Transcript_3054/g.6607 Transcript_3054/m.6607 type:complete len:286 (-) Transcript_3054:1946-2803(-)
MPCGAPVDAATVRLPAAAFAADDLDAVVVVVLPADDAAAVLFGALVLLLLLPELPALEACAAELAAAGVLLEDVVLPLLAVVVCCDDDTCGGRACGWAFCDAFPAFIAADDDSYPGFTFANDDDCLASFAVGRHCGGRITCELAGFSTIAVPPPPPPLGAVCCRVTARFTAVFASTTADCCGFRLASSDFDFLRFSYSAVSACCRLKLNPSPPAGAAAGAVTGSFPELALEESFPVLAAVAVVMGALLAAAAFHAALCDGADAAIAWFCFSRSVLSCALCALPLL